jgi:hypothetical protein
MEARLGPSMVELGSPESPSIVAASTPAETSDPDHTLEVPPGQSVQISHSIIALGEPAVGLDNVAAITPEARTSRHAAAPIVIRGGVVGDAFAPAAASAPVTIAPGASPKDTAEAPQSAGSTPQEPAPATAKPPTYAKKPE